MKKEIVLVGTFHFEQDTETIAHKETEINELVKHLARFKPQKMRCNGKPQRTTN
ncbi:hypothetical protein [Rossellomorea marisflavi]|uniref:hypothetical protein n=1 Tax=Rossellomorea marisflavi TaxID=189381 RepID=UPI00351575F8